MSTVPGKGIRTPALASGAAAGELAELMAPLGARIEVAGPPPGDAATRKLLRSVVIKGLEGLMVESMRAAEAAGLSPETWETLVDQFTAADGDFLRRMVEGTSTHARRLHEMEATEQMLIDLGIDPVMTGRRSRTCAACSATACPRSALGVGPALERLDHRHQVRPHRGGRRVDICGTPIGEIHVTTNDYRVNDQEWGPRSSVPLLGEHSHQVLRELGYDDAIKALIQNGVVRSTE